MTFSDWFWQFPLSYIFMWILYKYLHYRIILIWSRLFFGKCYYVQSYKMIYILLLLYLITPFFAYSAAKRKGRNPELWVLLTLLFSPAFLILECLSNINFNQIYLVHCEACEEKIAFAARFCPRCGQPRKAKAYYSTNFDHFSIICESVICTLQFIIVSITLLLLFLFYFFYSSFIAIDLFLSHLLS